MTGPAAPTGVERPAHRSLASVGHALAPAAAQRAALRRLPLAADFESILEKHGISPLRREKIGVFQINLGKVCNQTCRHCHVDAGPDRREQMTRETLDACLDAIVRTGAPVVDVTGGAPELHPDFRDLVARVRALGRRVIDRCNLTILETAPGRDLPAFLASHDVEVVASLPHHRALQTDRQRGEGVYEASLRALRKLNQEGYGTGRHHLALVTNPAGAFLPGDQAALEREWKRELRRLHGIEFDTLYTITNMPIARYLEWLLASGNLERYMQRLVRAFNPAAVAGLMCRTTVSVAWDGALYDCDFNQMLELPVTGRARHVRDLGAGGLEGDLVAIDRHCFGCTAGGGSSCTGTTARGPA